MAGQPRKRAMVAELERRARAFDDGTVLDYVADWVGSGKTLAELARDISERLQQGDEYVTRYMVSSYVNNLEGGRELLAEIRGEGAHGLADAAIRIVDEEAETREEIARNKNRAEMRLKMAGHWNRREYGEARGNQLNVNLDLGQLHLDAMRRLEIPTTPLALPPAAEGADYTILPGEIDGEAERKDALDADTRGASEAGSPPA